MTFTRLLLPALVLLAACASTAPIQDARQLYADGRGEEALALLERTMKERPADRAVRGEYFRTRELLIGQWLVQADALRAAGDFEPAAALYQRARRLDAGNARAAAGLAQLEVDRRHRGLIAAAAELAKAGKHREAQDTLRPVLAENPQNREARRLQRQIDDRLAPPVMVSAQLKPAHSRPISFELREVTVRNVFEVLQRASGISFVLDRDVRADQRTTITVRNAGIEEAIRLVLLTNQLDQKVINENTVFVYPNTPQKQREHQELVVKGFYLANADVKQTAQMIRTLVRTRDVFVDEKIGLLVIKDTPHAIRLAERLIAAQDLAEAEVMLEVEILEVATNRLRQLGARFPDTLAIGVQGAAGVPGTVTLTEWRNRTSDIVQLSFNNPLFLFSLKQQDGITNVLANPRIRVKNKEKARIHIGDRVPVITTTAAATGGFVSESVNYLDVGLKLEVEPVISIEDEVGIKVGLEVSNIVREIRGASSSTLTYQLGTRNASTNLRLRDGETQVLAGLISDDDRRSADRVPGLGELPVAGRLFSHTSDTKNRTEIVLLITPRIMRSLARPEASSVEFGAGTESAGGGPRVAVDVSTTPTTPALPVQQQQPPIPAAPGTPDASGLPAIPLPQPAPPPIVPFGGVQPPR
jgi:general secretion pathway protein D